MDLPLRMHFTASYKFKYAVFPFLFPLSQPTSISPFISALIYWLLRRVFKFHMCMTFPSCYSSFLMLFLFSSCYSSVMSLWSDQILRMLSIFSCLLRLALWPNACSLRKWCMCVWEECILCCCCGIQCFIYVF